MTFTTPTSRPESDELDAVVRCLEAERHARSQWWSKAPTDDERLQAARLAVLTEVVGEGEYGG